MDSLYLFLVNWIPESIHIGYIHIHIYSKNIHNIRTQHTNYSNNLPVIKLIQFVNDYEIELFNSP